MNRESSRSHAVFVVKLEITEINESNKRGDRLQSTKVARFSMVDLAGFSLIKSTFLIFLQMLSGII